MYERERDRVKREEREKIKLRTAVPAFFITLEFLTPHCPLLQDRDQKVERKTEAAACLKN